MKQNKNNYTPQPIDTKNVVLSEELNALAEEIAKNVHEVWSAERTASGWLYGKSGKYDNGVFLEGYASTTPNNP